MGHTVSEIAAALGAKAVGAVDLEISHAAEPAQATKESLALAMDEKYASSLAQGNARVAMLWQGADWQALGLEAAIFVARPRYAMSGLTAMLDPGHGIETGIHDTAVIHPSARIGEDAAIGPFVVIGRDVVIGAGARIASHVSVAEGACIGADALLLGGVKIGARVKIGDRFIGQPGAVVGGDGFSFVTPEESSVERARSSLGDQGGINAQSYARIHSLGSVLIGNDVELGANSCIDRGTIRDTIVGNGVKFDNLAQVGHNVSIGNDCLICAQVGIAGSSRIGNNVVLGGQSGVSDNLFVGDNVITGGATKVLANVPAGRVMLGYPAMKMDSQLQVYKNLRRLPRLFRDVAALMKSAPDSNKKP